MLVNIPCRETADKGDIGRGGASQLPVGRQYMEQTWASASGTRLRALAPNSSGCSQWRRSQARGRRPSSRPQPAAATRKAMQKDLQRSAFVDRSLRRLGHQPRCRGARYPLAMGIDRKLIALDRSARFVSAASRSIRPDSGAKVAKHDHAISIVNPRPPPGGAEHRGAQSHRETGCAVAVISAGRRIRNGGGDGLRLGTTTILPAQQQALQMILHRIQLVDTRINRGHLGCDVLLECRTIAHPSTAHFQNTRHIGNRYIHRPQSTDQG